MAFISGTGELPRNSMVTYVNVGSSMSREWEAVGVKVEDSAKEYNPDLETVTDILGITHTTINKLEPQQSFEPFTIRRDSKLAAKLFQMVEIDGDLTALKEFEVMTAYGFDGTAGAYTAKVEAGCTIEPTSLGGSGTLDFPFNVHFSGNKTMGTVNQLLPASGVTFTESSGGGI